MALRKVHLTTTALGDNRASFVNTTGDRLHIRKINLIMIIAGTPVVTDQAAGELAESPVFQSNTTDSRSVLALSRASGAPGGGAERDKIALGRNDLIVDPDDALFLNTDDTTGTPTIRCDCTIWYEA